MQAMKTHSLKYNKLSLKGLSISESLGGISAYKNIHYKTCLPLTSLYSVHLSMWVKIPHIGS